MGSGLNEQDQERRNLFAYAVSRLNPENAMLERNMNGQMAQAQPQPQIPRDVNELIQRKIASTEQSNMPMITQPPEKERVKARNEYEKEIRKYMQEREKLIKNQEERARILRQSQGFHGMDLSPLAALVDSETGSNLQRGYSAPMSQDQRNMLANKLQQQAGVGYGALANNEVQMAQMASTEEKRIRDEILRNRLISLKQNKPQKLSGEMAKRKDLVEGALIAIDDMSSNLEGVDSMANFSGVGSNKFTVAKDMFVENLGRMQSGGAINKEELKTFKQFAPKMTDNPEMRRYKLKKAKQLMQRRLMNISGGGTISPITQKDFTEEATGETQSVDSNYDALLAEARKRNLK